MSPQMFALAILPTVVSFACVSNKREENKVSFGLKRRLFLLGAAITVLAFILGELIDACLRMASVEGSLASSALEAFVGISLVEEGCKLLALHRCAADSPELTNVYRAIVCGVSVSLGFATLENILYVSHGGLAVALARMILCVPGHALYGMLMGYLFGLARRAKYAGKPFASLGYMALSLVVPMLAHGTYDFFCIIKNPLYLIAKVPTAIVAIRLARQMVASSPQTGIWQPFGLLPSASYAEAQQAQAGLRDEMGGR